MPMAICILYIFVFEKKNYVTLLHFSKLENIFLILRRSKVNGAKYGNARLLLFRSLAHFTDAIIGTIIASTIPLHHNVHQS